MTWQGLIGVLAAGLLAWLLYRHTQANPDAYSKANISKSFLTMGVLAIALIGFIALCIMFLRTS